MRLSFLSKEYIMRKLSLIVIIILSINNVYSQGSLLYQTGITAEQNLNAIANLSPYSVGAVGFDTRYEGIKGSPRLFDTLLTSLIKVRGQDSYMQLSTDIDLVGNTLIFKQPSTGKLFTIPASIISEVIINYKGKDLMFRTTESKKFEKKLKEEKFFQVLKEEPFQFIKMPIKDFIEADYKGAYSADRRYDEYKTIYKYYIMSSDSTFHQTQLTRKSLIKLFPDKKDSIIKTIEARSNLNNEEIVMSLLENF
jgi:hypothetical protein